MEAKSLIVLMFFLQSILNSVNLIVAQKPGPGQQSFKCSNNGNFKSDDLIKDRDFAFHLLSIDFGNRTGEFNAYDANTIRSISTLGLCNPNVKMEFCQECINNTIPYLTKSCPKQKEGVAWTVLQKVTCMVRYADHLLHGKLSEWAWTSFSSPPNKTPANAADLEKGLTNLANKLKEKIARGEDHLRVFAKDSLNYGPGPRPLYPLYGYMQCTPFIGKDCLKCLSDASNAILNCCGKGRKETGIAWSTNCYFWYAHVNFSPKKL